MTTRTRCILCPKGCELRPDQTGDCGVRRNIGGKIVCTTYGLPCSLHVDPVEKKPLYHFLPGTSILSMATRGCNLHCKQCQNWHISQAGKSRQDVINKVFPVDLSDMALANHCPSIAYTYTEPLVSFEYTYDCCVAAKDRGVRNVLVTAAYINPNPLRKICRFVDAANVDLKSFDENFYHSICGAALKPVLKALILMKESGILLEITNLIIPTLNDSEEETGKLCRWVAEHLGRETPIHFSRFYPHNQLMHLPPTATTTLLRAREIAREEGLMFVYVGNMDNREGEGTWCPSCGTMLVERSGYRIVDNLLEMGRCPRCSTPIHGIWE